MPTQRREDKRVEERTSAWERERGVGAGVVRKRQSGRERKKEKECTHAVGRERKRFGSSFYMFFPLPYANWA